ncbi:hypothetical protein [Nostoc linckia]|nr:hypothetical protein [Nostoc linckia]
MKYIPVLLAIALIAVSLPVNAQEDCSKAKDRREGCPVLINR